MNQIASALTETLQQVREVHLPGHRCSDGIWHNAPVKGADAECPTARAMSKAILAVTALHGQTRVAAEDPAAVAHVLWAMTGFDADTQAGLMEEEREGWMTTARDAILGLATYLDGDPVDAHFHGCPTPVGRPFDCDWCQDRALAMGGV